MSFHSTLDKQDRRQKYLVVATHGQKYSFCREEVAGTHHRRLESEEISSQERMEKDWLSLNVFCDVLLDPGCAVFAMT